MTLQELRKTAGFTQEKLGTLVGVSQRAIASYERGERRPSPVTAGRLASVFCLNTAQMWELFYAPNIGKDDQ